MQGRRRPNNTSVIDLEAGDYCLQQDGQFLAACDPLGNHFRLSKAKGWNWIDNDGVLTVRESIKNLAQTQWHGYLEQGNWRAT
jgi:hypothetical protein